MSRATSNPPAPPSAPTGEPEPTGRALRRLMACIGPANLSIALVWGAVPGILLALQVQRMVGEQAKVGTLALVTTVGAVFAMTAQPIAGVVSDRTRSRFGPRAPWIVAGTVTGAAALVAMAFMPSIPLLMAAWCVVQLGYNFAMGPLSAVMPDRVPVQKRGLFSAVFGLGTMLGSLFGQILAATFEQRITLAYIVLATLTAIAVTVFVILNPDRSNQDEPREPFRTGEFLRGFAPSPRMYPDFWWVFLGRLFTYLAYFLVFGYKLYILQDYIGLHDEAVDHVPALALATVAGILPATVICGPLSDRLGRRKIFVIASAALIGCSLVIPLVVPDMTGMLAMGFTAGLGFGCFQGVDTALISQVLPSEQSFAKDLGVVNVASTLPQVLAPAISGAVVLALGGFRTLFLAAAAFGLIGAAAVLRVRSVR
ncbi:MFS transporter [Kitasatospora sp. NPDC057500]|uniref:MFS transporter n=1 Tax=Kitasatospora sp. NPDC057500 TaxID=3346151 RepID=UPI0036876711